MIAKNEVREFLNNLQWNRETKSSLERKLQTFFEVDKEHTLCDFTDDDDNELDFSFGWTTGDGACAEHFVDIEIWYLKTRKKGVFIITGAEILDYVE